MYLFSYAEHDYTHCGYTVAILACQQYDTLELHHNHLLYAVQYAFIG